MKVSVSPDHEANGSVALIVTTGTLVVCAKMSDPNDKSRQREKKVRGIRGAMCLSVFIRLRRSVTARAG